MYGLHQAHKIQLRQELIIPHGGLISIASLTQEQALSILEDIIDDINEGGVDDTSLSGGNLFYTQYFNDMISRRLAKDAPADTEEEPAGARGEVTEIGPELRINADLTITELTGDIRAQIEERLAELKSAEPRAVATNFSKSFLEALDWVSEKRGEITRHLIEKQAGFLKVPHNPLLLKHANQDSVAEDIGVTASTVSRLVRSFKVIFPDESVHSIKTLMPGPKLPKIKAKHALELMKDDPSLYDPERQCWTKSSIAISEELNQRFGTQIGQDLKARTVRKYMKEMGEKRKRGAIKEPNPKARTMKSIIIAENDAILAEYMKDDRLFNPLKGKWRRSAVAIRERIIEETGVKIPLKWIKGLRYNDCKSRPYVQI